MVTTICALLCPMLTYHMLCQGVATCEQPKQGKSSSGLLIRVSIGYLAPREGCDASGQLLTLERGADHESATFDLAEHMNQVYVINATATKNGCQGFHHELNFPWKNCIIVWKASS